MFIKTVTVGALSAAASIVCAADTPFTTAPPVVVTATRFEERYADKPINMTVITAEDIRASPAKTVPDLLAEQAGITIHDLFGNNAATTTVDLRGFGVTGTQNTLILVDGRRVVDIDLSGVQWSAVPLDAIDRIEIVRGGSSVLYGEGASAGVINIITRSPAAGAAGLTVRGSLGSYDTREGVVRGTLSRGSVGLSLFGSNFESDGYRRNNHNRQTNALADLRWSGTGSDVSLKLGTENQGIRLPGARLVQPSAGINQLVTDRRGATTPLDWAQQDGNRALFDWRRDLPFGEFHLGAGYPDKSQRSFFDFGGFPDYREIDLDVWSFTPRIKVNVPIAGKANTLVAGVDWYIWDYQRRRSNSQDNIGRPINDVNAREETIGVYALDTFALTDRLSVSAGVRRERLRINASDRFDPAAPGASFFDSAAPASSQHLYENAYEAGFRYQFVAPAIVTAKAARSYRFANVDEIYEFSPIFTNEFQFLRPQTARSYDLSLELGRGARWGRATLFQIDVDDEIHLDPFSTGLGNRNLPRLRRRGVELEAHVNPLQPLHIAVAYTFIDAKFREGELPGSPFGTNLAGKTVPLVPKNKVVLKSWWNFTAGTQLSAVASYVGDQFMDNDEPNTLGTKIPSYTVVDLKLTHRSGPWLLAASVNNLFGEKYYNYAVRSQFVADRYNAYPLPERNGMVSVEYQFK